MKILLIATLCGCAFLTAVNAQQKQQLDDKARWISAVIQETSTVKPGMTCADLLRVFIEEGGLSTGIQRTYAFHDCPYIKVDVEFEAVGRPARDINGRVTLVEDKNDLIKSISKPYLDFAVLD